MGGPRRRSQPSRAALDRLEVPVTVAFGSRDEYLSPAVAARLGSLFARGTVGLVDDASHWPQQDQPAAVAKVIKKAAAQAAIGRAT